MNHDDKCTRWDRPDGNGPCRCEARALEAKLAEANEGWTAASAALADYAVTKEWLVAAESRLAALRPLVRAAHAWSVGKFGVDEVQLELECERLSTEQIEWAKGGE